MIKAIFILFMGYALTLKGQEVNNVNGVSKINILTINGLSEANIDSINNIAWEQPRAKLIVAIPIKTN